MKVRSGTVHLLILQPSSFILPKDFLIKIRQFHRRRGGFKSLVTQLDASTINRLINRVCSYNSENYRHSCLQTCLANSSGDFRSDVFEMRSLTADDCAQANDGSELFRFGKP